MATPMTAQELEQYILRKLGAPFLKVELGEDHLKDAISDAKAWFSAKKGMKGYATINFNGTHEYVLPDEADTVLAVTFSAHGNDIDRIIDPLSLVDGFPKNTLMNGGTMGMISSYAQVSQYLEMAKRVLGTELEWYQEGRKLVVLPPPASGSARIEFKANTFTIEQLNERDHEMVKQMSLANAKETLGRIRSKFDSYPTAQGSVTMDGSALLDEARAEKEALEEEIGASAMPMGFVVG